MAVNEQQRHYWTNVAGPEWVSREAVFDRMIGPHGVAVVEALNAQPGERVLDVGCGFGTTTRAVADAVGPSGSVTGVDISQTMITRATQRTSQPNAHFVVADAQADQLGGPYDAVVSRFGVMFFDDPVAAFTNIHRSTNGRLAFVCWQGAERNFFSVGPRIIRPLLPDPPAAPPADAPGPLAFADPERVRHILRASGWHDVEIAAKRLPARFDVKGSDGVEEGIDQIMRSEIGRIAARQLDETTLAAVRERVEAEMRSHMVDGVVEYESNVWIVTARA